MRNKFCPKCGRETEKFYDRVCENCFISKVSLVKKLPDKIVVKTCKSCEKIFVEDKTATSVENAIDIVLSELLKQPEIQSASYRITDNKVHVTLNLKIDDLKKTEEKIFNLIAKKIRCKYCGMKFTGYYQAILQLRVPKNMQDLMLDEVESQLDNINRYNNLAFITKIDKRPEGYDVYVGSKPAASHVANILKNKFKANIKISRKLSGIMSGKRISRDTILIYMGE